MELLDLDHSEEDRKKAVELLQEAENHAGNKNKDVLELCACAYLKLGNLNEAARLLRKLVNWGYNAEVNVQILSAIYLHIISPNNPESTDNDRLKASEEYSELRFVTQPQYILPKPSTEEEWAKWTPMWEKHDASDIDETEKPASQSLDSPQVEKSIANVMGWVANRGGFDAVTAYETENYYLIAFEDSGLYSSGVPLRNNLQPSLIRMDKKTGRIFSNRIDSASRNYGKDNSFYWGKRINCIRGDVVFRNDHGRLQYLDVGNLKDWQNLADFRNGRYRYGRIIQGNEAHLVFPLNGKICDYNTVYNRCEEVCDFPAAFYSHMDFYSTPFYLTNDEIFILDKDSVYFYDLVKKQSTLLFEVSDVNCICYVRKHSDPKSGKYLIFYFIREGFSSDHSLIKKVILSEDSKKEEIVFDDLPNCYGICCDHSFVHPYDDCVIYANKDGLLKKILHNSPAVEEIASGVLCEQREETGKFRKKVEYKQIPAGFVRIGTWIYFYQDGARSKPARVSLDAPNEIEIVPTYDNLENVQVIEQPDTNN